MGGSHHLKPNLLDSRPKNLCGAELPSGRGNNLSLSKSTSSGELLLADWTIHWSAPLSLSPAPPDSDCIFSPFFGPPLKGLIKACSPPTTYNFFFTFLLLFWNIHAKHLSQECLRHSWRPLGSSLKSQIWLKLCSRADKINLRECQFILYCF